jgi:hypothetical protein
MIEGIGLANSFAVGNSLIKTLVKQPEGISSKEWLNVEAIGQGGKLHHSIFLARYSIFSFYYSRKFQSIEPVEGFLRFNCQRRKCGRQSFLPIRGAD